MGFRVGEVCLYYLRFWCFNIVAYLRYLLIVSYLVVFLFWFGLVVMVCVLTDLCWFGGCLFVCDACVASLY